MKRFSEKMRSRLAYAGQWAAALVLFSAAVWIIPELLRSAKSPATNENSTPEVSFYYQTDATPNQADFLAGFQREVEAMKVRDAKEKADLYTALRTRVLSKEEFEKAQSMGLYLVLEEMIPYDLEEKQRELDEAFLQQARLRAVSCAPAP